jgi:hypothetical protein
MLATSWQQKSDSPSHLNNENNVNTLSQIAHTNLFRELLTGASGNNEIELTESRKVMKYQHFSGFFIFRWLQNGYNEGIFCSQRCSHEIIELVGYFGLFIGVEMAVSFHGGFDALMAQALGDEQGREAHFH